MFVHYRTSAFVLKKEGRGETDELFTFYTKDFGKLAVLGKSIRKIDSKLRSGADIFYFSEIEFIQGKGRKTLTDAVLMKRFDNIRNDLARLKTASEISEVLDSLVRVQGGADGKIWQLLAETFEELDGAGEAETVYYYFFWKLVSVLGYEPDLYHCAICQKKLIPQGLRFLPEESGIVCQGCLKESKSAQKISPETVKILRIIAGGSFNNFKKLKIDNRYLKELKLISEKYYSALCENLSSF